MKEDEDGTKDGKLLVTRPALAKGGGALRGSRTDDDKNNNNNPVDGGGDRDMAIAAMAAKFGELIGVLDDPHCAGTILQANVQFQ
jgi:hypothetical protein